MKNIGDYEVLGEIGRGGMGVVYEARRPDHAETVALKALRATAVPDPRARERFLREGAAAGRLDHPGIVRVLEAGEADGTLFIAMEYVRGTSLDLIIGEARARPDPAGEPAPGDETLPPGNAVHETVEWVRDSVTRIRDAAEALQYAHERGVVHRDVKPQNLLLTEDGAVKLTDFGVARLEDETSITVTGELMGTPLYMSPEQAIGDARGVDARTDVYALGATLFESLTLSPPFTGATGREVIRKIHSAPVPSPRSFNRMVDARLSRILRKCLAKAPRDRYASAGDLARDLTSYLEGGRVRARPVGRLRLLARAVKARPLLAVGLLQLLGAVVLGGSLLIGSWGRSRVLAGGNALLSVTGVPPGVAVRLYQIDPARYDWSEEGRAIGTGKVTDFELRPGNYLVRARTADLADEVQCVLKPADDFRVELELRSAERTTKGMVRIPAAELLFQGSLKVRVRSFWVGKKEVTHAEWKAYVDDVPGVTVPRGWSGGAPLPGVRGRPVNFVSRSDAIAYAHWRGARLPTEAEWELAAGGPDCLNYPWGNEPVAERIETYYPGSPNPAEETADGVRDTLGEMLEWIAHRRYMFPPSMIDPDAPPDSLSARGGSFSGFDPARLGIYGHRQRGIATYNTGNRRIGIRLVRSDWND